MASQQQKKQTLEYLADKLQQTALYSIHRSTNNRSLSVSESTSYSDQPKIIDIVIPNFFNRVADFKEFLYQNRNRDIHTSPIFYKDGTTSFALLQDTPKFWEHDQTLKRYTADQKHSMLNLRDMERFILENFGKDVTYYQPQTSRLQESVRVFTLGDVHLDYSHIPPEDPKYSRVQNRVSLDYKLPVEKPTLGPALALESFSEHDPYKRARLVSMEPMTPEFWEQMHPSKDTITAELQASAQHAYPGIKDPEEALRMYLGGEDQ